MEQKRDERLKSMDGSDGAAFQLLQSRLNCEPQMLERSQ